LEVIRKLVASIALVKKEEKKSQAKKTKEPEPAARKVVGKGTKATANKVAKAKPAANLGSYPSRLMIGCGW
jgi:hypothetical protein